MSKSSSISAMNALLTTCREKDEKIKKLQGIFNKLQQDFNTLQQLQATASNIITDLAVNKKTSYKKRYIKAEKLLLHVSYGLQDILQNTELQQEEN